MREAALVGMWAAVAAAGLYSSCARADPVQFNCQQLAVAIQNAAQLRDLGADVDKVVAFGKKNSGMVGAHWAVLDRELRRVWKRGLPVDAAAQDVFRRCQAQLGDMGRDG